MRFSGIAAVFLAGIIGVGSQASAAPKRVLDPLLSGIVPQAGIPVMSRKPVIDGNLGQQEWQDALCITGFTMMSYLYNLPRQLQARVYIGYDSMYLYLGLIQPQLGKPLRDRKLTGNQKNNHGPYLGSPHWWLKFHTPKNGGYEFMMTSAGDLRDRNNASSYTMNQGLGWNSNAVIKTRINGTRWTAELKIPFASMGYNNGPALNERWRVHLMYGDRGGDRNQAGWNGERDFRNNELGEIIFSGKIPAFQLLDTGRLSKLEFAPKFRVSNPTGKAQEIDLKVSIQSWKDILIDRSRKFRLRPGEVREIAFKRERITLPKGRSGRLEIDVNTAQDHLYSAWLQFDELNFTRFNRLLPFGLKDPDFEGHWDLKCANYPYYKSMDVWVDCKYNHLAAAVRAASSCRVRLKDSKAGKTIRQGRIPVEAGSGRIAWKGIDLPDGEYEIHGRLYSGNRAVGKPMVHRFERRVFAWEHNKIGISDKVYPPFTPIKVAGSQTSRSRSLSPWGRKYEIGNNALPGRIIATEETPVPGKVICGSFRLELTSAGKTEEIKGRTKVTTAKPGIVRLESSSRKGKLKFDISSFMQYDGWYQATIRITPRSPVKMDRLALVIPFGAYPDTHYGYRRSWFYGGFPRQTGTLWQNLGKGKNLFTPCLAVGNGDVCLWWYANSDQQWQLDYSKASQMITRDADGINLRMLLVNHPVKLEKPMEMTFAVLANPAKPYPKNRREKEWGFSRLKWHDTSGYGFWGDGMDSITCGTDKEYRRTSDTIDRWTGRNKPDAPRPFPVIVLYNSGAAIGHCMPEFATFSGEWCDVTPHEPRPEFKDSDLHARVPWIHPNMGHQQDWRSFPDKLVPGWGDMTWSSVDCRIWHYKRNMEKLGINGYWFDNSPIGPGKTLGTGRAYLTSDGQLRPNYNIFERQSVFRRLFVMYREKDRRPFNLVSYAPDFSFAQWIWMVEMDAYIEKGETMFDTLSKRRWYDVVSRIIAQDNTILDPIARHRAITRMRSVPGATWTSDLPGQIKASRSVMGLCLLHDFGCFVDGRLDKGERYKFRRVLRGFGFADPKIKYLPYWRNSEYVKTDTPGVVVSLYQNPRTRETFGIIVNPGKNSVQCKLTLNAEALKNPVLENPEDHSIFRIAKKNGAISTAISIEDCGIALFLLREKGIRDRRFSNTGTLDREYWKAIKGRPLADVLKRGKEPDGKDRLKSFASCSWDNPNVTRNWATDFGERIRGFLIPPETGEYIFWMYSDDRGQLFISRDTRPENVRLVAEVPICGSEESQPVRLEEGKVYYVEALHAQKAGGTSFSVGWKTPFDYSKKNLHEPIPGKYLSSFSAGVPKAE